MTGRDVRQPKLFDYKRLLAGYFRANPVWRDLADATNDALGAQVHRYRRSLQTIRDSQQYRVGDILPEAYYDPADPTDYPVDESGNPVPLTPQTRLTDVKIKAIEQFASNHGEAGTTDYLTVEFKIADGRVLEWKMPVDVGVHQEKSVLISNAAMLGFDFMAKGLSGDDYRRLYDFVSQYWPEGGQDNFVRFMAFVKDIKLSLEPLWSRDDDTDTFPFLEPKRAEFVPAWRGGDYYQTSHVELRYYPRDIENINDLSMDELKDLFYYMAPIHLVLERIVGVIEQDYDIFVALAGQEFQIHQAKLNYKSTPGITGDLLMHVGEMQIVAQSHEYWEPEILRADIGLSAQGQNEGWYTTREKFIPGDSDSLVDLEHVGYFTTEATTKFQWMPEHLWWDGGIDGQAWSEDWHTAKENYVSGDYSLTYDVINVGRLSDFHYAKLQSDYYGLVLDGWISDFQGQADMTFLAKQIVLSVEFPELLMNALYMGGFGFSSALILGVVEAADPVNPVYLMKMDAGGCSAIYVSKVTRIPAAATLV